MTAVLTATRCELRRAEARDLELFWRWTNEPTVRANGFNPQPVSWDDHVYWFNSRLRSQRCCIWVMEEDGVPVGQIRYERLPDGRSAEISISVGSEHRGKGFGSSLIMRTRELALADLGVDELQAVAFVDNLPSQRAFLRAGFKQVGPQMIRGRDCYRFLWRGGSR